LTKPAIALSPVFTVKGGKRYRYYISNRLETARRKDASGWRLPAAELEQTVIHQFCLLLHDEVRLAEWTRTFRSNASIEITLAKAATLRETALQTLSIRQRAKLLKHVFPAITIKPDAIVFEVNPQAVIDALLGDNDAGQRQVPGEAPALIALSVPMTLRRRGCEAKLVVAGHLRSEKPDDGLVERARAHLLLRKLTDGSGQTIADVADAAAIHVADVSRILPLAFLAPSITDAIFRGRQPVELTSRVLMRDVDLPALWADQLRHLRM
jgi:hypothetical protein